MCLMHSENHSTRVYRPSACPILSAAPLSSTNPAWATYHCVQLLRSIPVRARVVRMAVLMSTPGSSFGFGPSRDGDHGPPMAIGSDLPFSPTKNWMRRVGCWKASRTSAESSAMAHDLWNTSSRRGFDSNITYKR